VSNIIAEPNDDFSHNHFELLNFILAQKLTILEGGFIGGLFVYWSFLSIFEVEQRFTAQNHHGKNCY
jgi:hypothetical protein